MSCPGGITVTVEIHCALCRTGYQFKAGAFLTGFPSRGAVEKRARATGWRKRMKGGWRCLCCNRWEMGCFREGQRVRVRVFSEAWGDPVIRSILPPGEFPPLVELDYPNGRWNRLGLSELEELARDTA